ncbi:MAG: class I SAM-dependent methyltransferase [Gemmatimonadota bacterium]|nr:class I SAM-dependent methyltransferase [Gemmatimonadota bacterium]
MSVRPSAKSHESVSAFNAYDLHGADLEAWLERKFVLVDEPVTLSAHGTATEFALRKPQNADALISEVDYVMDERLPYWADLWPAARLLATTALEANGSGKTLLELGCGLGLATAAAVHAGYAVTATDYYEDALHVARLNSARVNCIEPAVRMVDWRALPADLGQFDIVMAADVLYERPYGTLVAAAIAASLKTDGEAWITDPGRSGLDVFLEQAAVHGLRVISREEFPYEDGPKIRQTIRRFRLVRS